MSFFRILLLLAFSFTVHAEQTNPAAPQKSATDDVKIYTKQSGEAVDTLNKATEVLRDPTKALPLPEVGKTVDKVLYSVTDKKELPRDPTQMSGNFRQALKNMPTSGANNANPNAQNAAPPAIPPIELAAKILGKNKSVMLKINTRIVQIAEGGRVSLFENQRVITVRVDKIDKNQVKISVLPVNEQLILQ